MRKRRPDRRDELISLLVVVVISSLGILAGMLQIQFPGEPSFDASAVTSNDPAQAANR